MKLALFQDIDKTLAPRVEDPEFERDANNYGYCRISEYVEVEFPPLGPDTRQQQLVAIDRYESSRRESFEADMSLIGELRVQLQGDAK